MKTRSKNSALGMYHGMILNIYILIVYYNGNIHSVIPVMQLWKRVPPLWVLKHCVSPSNSPKISPPKWLVFVRIVKANRNISLCLDVAIKVVLLVCVLMIICVVMYMTL